MYQIRDYSQKQLHPLPFYVAGRVVLLGDAVRVPVQ